MSLKRTIARNIARQDENYLKQYARNLSPNWKSLPAAQKSLIANMSRNGITPQDLENAREQGRRSAYEDTAPAVQAVAYSAMGCVLHDMLGISDEDVMKIIMAVDEKIYLAMDFDEISKELEEKCKLKIHSKEGVGRIEKVS